METIPRQSAAQERPEDKDQAAVTVTQYQPSPAEMEATPRPTAQEVAGNSRPISHGRTNSVVSMYMKGKERGQVRQGNDGAASSERSSSERRKDAAAHRAGRIAFVRGALTILP